MKCVTYRLIEVAMKTGSRNEVEQRSKPTVFGETCLDSGQKSIEHVARVRQCLFEEWRDILAAHGRLFSLAPNQAVVVAWQTEVPCLAVPALGEEKIRTSIRWNTSQQSLNSGRPAAFAA